jgi:hypothetical protein
MAGLDEFRFAMTGGNRVVDLPNSGSNPGGLTVLERSYQSSQGSNFMTKTFTEDGYSTGFASGATLSIVNSGRGVQMVVTNTSGGTTAGTATCVGPQLVSGSFNCGGGGTSYGYTLSNGDTTNCGGGYTGTGSSASPYTCSSFNNSSGGLPVATPTGSTSSVLVPSPTAGSVTLSCPSNSFTSSPYACTAALSNGATGTCSSWGGSGTAGSPYECTGFGTFSGGESFAINIPGGASGTASATDTNSIPYTNSSVTCTVSGTTPTTTCSSLDGNGTTATCSTYITTGSGSSTRYYCTSFALSGSTDTFSSATNPATTFTTVSSKNITPLTQL